MGGRRESPLFCSIRGHDIREQVYLNDEHRVREIWNDPL
jgi:hypothetical protein